MTADNGERELTGEFELTLNIHRGSVAKGRNRAQADSPGQCYCWRVRRQVDRLKYVIHVRLAYLYNEDRRQDSLQPSGGNWEQDAASTEVVICYK